MHIDDSKALKAAYIPSLSRFSTQRPQYPAARHFPFPFLSILFFGDSGEGEPGLGQIVTRNSLFLPDSKKFPPNFTSTRAMLLPNPGADKRESSKRSETDWDRDLLPIVVFLG
jgi:hypothetical protein